MRNLEDIENDLTAAREALSSVEGTPAEVYSRIVGYYRSVRNWNRGKREEYGERLLYRIDNCDFRSAANSPPPITDEAEEKRLLLFVRYTCPACPPAKAAAGRLGIPVDMVNTDSEEGIKEAIKRNVMSTPTAILLSPRGNELARAKDAETISHILEAAPAIAV
ncbi:MAG: anaerobic ribonucleoside-triphosphate reductase [Treponema sp.]|nr:anaerobic ribonucleoside-triphosphate reductase [Treponema sp.]